MYVLLRSLVSARYRTNPGYRAPKTFVIVPWLLKNNVRTRQKQWQELGHLEPLMAYAVGHPMGIWLSKISLHGKCVSTKRGYHVLVDRIE